jgi:hypothetical protein
MSDAEVIATALVAMRLFGDNFASARPYLESEGYVPRMLSKSQFNQRLHRVAPKLKCLFLILARVHKTQSDEDVYLVDSFPVPVCYSPHQSVSPLPVGGHRWGLSRLYCQQTPIFLWTADSCDRNRQGPPG